MQLNNVEARLGGSHRRWMIGWHGLRHSRGRGFTLIEALIAIVLVGVAMAALIVSNQSFTSANGAGLQVSTAEFLIEQVRERTAAMTFTQLVNANLNGQVYSPPRDSQGNNLTEYPGYSQRITAQYVTASDLRTPSGSATPFYRVTIEVRLNNETLSSASWLRANY
jgi:prepilin-type N-terminal cleavage/methylation domain-containing protein